MLSFSITLARRSEGSDDLAHSGRVDRVVLLARDYLWLCCHRLWRGQLMNLSKEERENLDQLVWPFLAAVEDKDNLVLSATTWAADWTKGRAPGAVTLHVLFGLKRDPEFYVVDFCLN